MSNQLTFKTPSFRLDGRRALVTGGSKGIGLASAHALAQAGAQVLVVARNEPELKAACTAIDAGCGNDTLKSSFVVLDVKDSKAVDALFVQHGPFDVVLSNAGTNRAKPLVEYSDDDLDFVLDLNVKAAFYVARAAARSMSAANKGGSIITMSSQMGHVGSPKRVVYCASKHAMEGMTRGLAWELGSKNIRVNTICPTFIETELTAPFLADPAFKQFVQSKVALGRVGRLEEIMGAVVFLASDASSLITGTALLVDGGWTAA